jgi:hypothetical protein
MSTLQARQKIATKGDAIDVSGLRPADASRDGLRSMSTLQGHQKSAATGEAIDVSRLRSECNIT